MKLANISVADYKFDEETNPYQWDEKSEPIELVGVARIISDEVNKLATDKPLLIRGVQSKKHDLDKTELISLIAEKGTEYENTDEPNTIFAAPYEEDAILRILEGFHKYKPKCEDRPQYPVDLWLVFDATAYTNVEYIHPRHNVLTKDKWKRISPEVSGLLALVVIETNS